MSTASTSERRTATARYSRSMEELEAIAAAPIGVFAWVRGDGTPGSCAVTPFVINRHIIVTSTLAFTAKAAAVRRDARVAVLAGGQHVVGRAEVFVDESLRWFDENIRQAEIEKFPPTRSILAIPGHRCFFPWYVGRIVIRFLPEQVTRVGRGDSVTATQMVDSHLRVTPIALEPSGAPIATRLDDGPTHVLVHQEHRNMADLRQLSIRGSVVSGRFEETARNGSLMPGPTGMSSQISQLRSLASSAKRNKALIRSWRAA